jgi:hypothetical protein
MRRLLVPWFLLSAGGLLLPAAGRASGASAVSVQQALAAEPARAGALVRFVDLPVRDGRQNMIVRAVEGSNLAVVWWQERQDRRGGVYIGRTYSLSGVPRSPVYRISGESERCYGRPGVAFVGGGALVAAWSCSLSGHGGEGGAAVFVRFFRPEDGAAGPPRRLATGATPFQDIEVERLGESGALVLWRRGGSAQGAGAAIVEPEGPPENPPGWLSDDLERATGPPAVARFPGGLDLVWRGLRGLERARLDGTGAARELPVESPGESPVGEATPSPTGDFGAVALDPGTLWIVWRSLADPAGGVPFEGLRIGSDGGRSSLGLLPEPSERPERSPVLVHPATGPVMALWPRFVPDEDARTEVVLARLEAETGLGYESPIRLSVPGSWASWPQLALNDGEAFATWLVRRDGGAHYELVGRPVASDVPGARPRSEAQVACAVEAQRAALRAEVPPQDEQPTGEQRAEARCGPEETVRDRRLRQALESMLAPEGEAAGLKMKLTRGRSIDDFRVEVAARGPGGDLLATASFRVGVEISVGGEPEALRLETVDASEPRSSSRALTGLVVSDCPGAGRCVRVGGVEAVEGASIDVPLNGPGATRATRSRLR